MFISHVHKIPLHISNCILTSHIFILWIVRSIKYLSIFWLHSSWWFPDFVGPPLRGKLSFSRGLPDPNEALEVGALLAGIPSWPIPSCLFRKASNLIDKAESKTGFGMIYYNRIYHMINEYEWCEGWYSLICFTASLHIRGFCTDILFTVAEETQLIFRVPSLESRGYGYILRAPSS